MYQSSRKRARLRRRTVIEAELAELEEDYRNTGSEDTQLYSESEV